MRHSKNVNENEAEPLSMKNQHIVLICQISANDYRRQTQPIPHNPARKNRLIDFISMLMLMCQTFRANGCHYNGLSLVEIIFMIMYANEFLCSTPNIVLLQSFFFFIISIYFFYHSYCKISCTRAAALRYREIIFYFELSLK